MKRKIMQLKFGFLVLLLCGIVSLTCLNSCGFGNITGTQVEEESGKDDNGNGNQSQD